jgi:signal recognition particle receptor subunit beta
MEILYIVMGIELVVIILGIIGIIIARKDLLNFYRSLRPKYSIAVLGTEGSGKTTLINYLCGEPLPDMHTPTAGARARGKIVCDLSGNQTHYFRSREMYDVGGDQTGQWKAVIREQNPDGIIYLVDSTNPERERDGLITLFRIYEELSTEMIATGINLRAILILINKADIWGPSEEQRVEMARRYRDEVVSGLKVEFCRLLPDLVLLLDWSSLLHAEYQFHLNNVLRRFMAVLTSEDDAK